MSIQSVVTHVTYGTPRKYSMDGRRFGSDKSSANLIDLRTIDVHLSGIRKLQEDVDKFYAIFEEASHFRKSMLKLTESRFFTTTILLVILINTFTIFLGSRKDLLLPYAYNFGVLEAIFIAIYIVEAGIKIYVWRKYYFMQGWDVLDFVIIFTSLCEIIAPFIFSARAISSGSSIFRILRVLRALRSLRVLRTIRFIENTQVILITCLHSFQSLGTILMLMGIFLVIFAVAGRGFFGTKVPIYFGDFALTCFTLIQLLTLDDWYQIFTDRADELGYFDIPMFLYLLLYIIIEYFVFLNLFIAVLVDNFQLTLGHKMVRKAEEKERLLKAKQLEAEQKEQHEDSESEDNLETLREKLIFRDEVTSSAELDVGSEKDYMTFMENATPVEKALGEAYYRVLPAIEKEFHVHSNYIACHDRVLDLIVDNTDDVIERR